MKVLRQKSFMVFAVFCVSAKLFLYENLRWRYSDMDLRESMWDSMKGFCEDLRVQLATKLFCLKTFMVYGS